MEKQAAAKKIGDKFTSLMSSKDSQNGGQLKNFSIKLTQIQNQAAKQNKNQLRNQSQILSHQQIVTDEQKRKDDLILEAEQDSSPDKCAMKESQTSGVTSSQ